MTKGGQTIYALWFASVSVELDQLALSFHCLFSLFRPVSHTQILSLSYFQWRSSLKFLFFCRTRLGLVHGKQFCIFCR